MAVVCRAGGRGRTEVQRLNRNRRVGGVEGLVREVVR